MKLKISSEKDFLRYVSSLNIDEGLRILLDNKIIIITRYDLQFYLEIRSNKIKKLTCKNENEVLENIKKYLKFPLYIELY